MTVGAAVQIFYELAPVVAFFVAGQLFSFATAVWVLMGATLLSIVVAWTYHRHVPFFPLASAALVFISGAITVYFDNPNAIILADTIYFWGLASAILIGFKQKKHLLERMFDKTFAITAEGWTKLSWRWFAVLVVAGAANEYVRMTMTPEFWIDYRFTKVALIMLFSLYQFTLARQYRIEGESSAWGLRTKEV